MRSLTVLIPAHNEGNPVGGATAVDFRAPILDSLNSLLDQTKRPQRVIVIADNCTDDTADIARSVGAEVFVTQGNEHKKAGALNQWLDENLPNLPDDDLVMVMDADSALDSKFLETAVDYIDRGYGAVGGIFLGKEGGGFVGMLQRNEYARYARDIDRRSGRTLVLTGTATVFKVSALKDVVVARMDGRLPGTGPTPHVYDTKALTEDNELTFALLHLGHQIIAPPECKLTTEVMETWRDLRRQRFRWKRGAIENNHHYGVTKYTLKYHALQWWSGIGIVVTMVYLATLLYALATNQFHVMAIWLIVTVIFSLERIITVRSRGWKQMLLAGTIIVEMPYDITLQYVQGKAFFAALLGTKKSW